jgi:hypothetical protein
MVLRGKSVAVLQPLCVWVLSSSTSWPALTREILKPFPDVTYPTPWSKNSLLPKSTGGMMSSSTDAMSEMASRITMSAKLGQESTHTCTHRCAMWFTEDQNCYSFNVFHNQRHANIVKHLCDNLDYKRKFQPSPHIRVHRAPAQKEALGHSAQLCAYLKTKSYCGTIHNSQVMETAKMPHHWWMD